MEHRAVLSRRFHAFCVGLPKTGTTSITGIFKRYKAGHEFMFRETVEHIVLYRQGRITKEAFRNYLIERDKMGGLEMDSASFNHYYLHFLVDLFPEARFVFTVRDCFSWTNSYLSMLLRWRRIFPDVRHIPAWQTAYGRIQFGQFDPDDYQSPETIMNRMPDLATRFFQCWREDNRRILSLLPAGRSIVIPTARLSRCLPELARLMGIPPDFLLSHASHANRAPEKINFLSFLDNENSGVLCLDESDPF